jgi:hypothetical protein
MQCFNVGWNGGKVSDWAVNVNGFDPQPALIALNCDLIVLTTGINEWGTSNPASTFQTQLDAYVAALLVNSDVVLCTPYPSQRSSYSLTVQTPYVAAIYAVAAKYGLAVNDVWQKIGSWERYNGFGWTGDNLHYQKAVYQLKAEADAALLTAILS